MSRMKMALGLGGTALLLVAGGILGTVPQRAQAMRSFDVHESESLAMRAPSAAYDMAGVSRKTAKTPGGPAEEDPKLIRTGQLSLEVQDYGRAMRDVARLVKAAGGYVASQSSSQGEHEKRRGEAQIRLPATAFEGGLSSLESLGKVRSESLGIQDVGKEYVDLQARLRVKQQMAQRLEGLLRDHTAKLSDVLAAEKELERVAEEIESMEGERRFYDHRMAFCTLDLALIEPQALVEPGALSPLSRMAERTVETLASSFSFLVSSLAFLTPWMLLGALVWGIRRRLRRPATSQP